MFTAAGGTNLHGQRSRSFVKTVSGCLLVTSCDWPDDRLAHRPPTRLRTRASPHRAACFSTLRLATNRKRVDVCSPKTSPSNLDSCHNSTPAGCLLHSPSCPPSLRGTGLHLLSFTRRRGLGAYRTLNSDKPSYLASTASRWHNFSIVHARSQFGHTPSHCSHSQIRVGNLISRLLGFLQEFMPS